MPDTKLTWFNIKEHIRKFLWVYIAVIAATLVAGNLLWISTAPRVPEEQRVLIYMADGSHFPNGDLEQVMGALAVHVFPWIILGLAVLIVTAELQGKSIQREYDAIMARIKEEKDAGIKAEPQAAKPAPNVNVLRWIILAVAVVFIVIGIRNGSMMAVVNKAIRICTECVGLG